MPNKYGNRKVTTKDGVFDSNKEATRWGQLKLMANAGLISNLERQVKRTLIPAQYIDGKCVERAVTYTSDFEYDQDGKHIVEDTKGMKTDKYIIKRKLMLWLHGIRIKEV